MFKLTWQAHPPLLITLLVFQVAQGAFPVATAWISKLFIDTLVTVIQGQAAAGAVAAHVVHVAPPGAEPLRRGAAP